MPQQTPTIYEKKTLKFGTEPKSSLHASVAHGSKYEENPSWRNARGQKTRPFPIFCLDRAGNN